MRNVVPKGGNGAEPSEDITVTHCSTCRDLQLPMEEVGVEFQVRVPGQSSRSELQGSRTELQSSRSELQVRACGLQSYLEHEEARGQSAARGGVHVSSSQHAGHSSTSVREEESFTARGELRESNRSLAGRRIGRASIPRDQ
ncbi:unnamed protein product [Gadus morhua 'NCC']